MTGRMERKKSTPKDDSSMNHSNVDDHTVVSSDTSKYLPSKNFIVCMTHLNIVLYSMCFWIQTGVLPYLTKKLGVDTQMFGMLQSTFAFIQLCGGPMFGRFGDLFGGKYSLLLAFFACFSSYGLLAIAANIPMLFLSRVPSAAMHSMQGSQMVITDVTTDEERASGIGQLGISYGVGMVIGPLIGGFLTERFNEQTAAATAALGSIVSIALVLLFIPSDTKSYQLKTSSTNSEKKHENVTSSGSVFDFKKYRSVFQVPNFAYIFLIKVVSSAPLGILQAMFSVVAMDFFHLDPKGNGLVLSYVGIMAMLVQGFGVSFLTKRFSDIVLIKYSILLITVSYVMLTFVSTIYMFLFVLIPLTVGGAVSGVIITSVVTKTVAVQDTGTALGLLMTTHSLIRTISPSIGGFVYGALGFPVFGVIGMLINGVLALYLFRSGNSQLDSVNVK